MRAANSLGGIMHAVSVVVTVGIAVVATALTACASATAPIGQSPRDVRSFCRHSFLRRAAVLRVVDEALSHPAGPKTMWWSDRRTIDLENRGGALVSYDDLRVTTPNLMRLIYWGSKIPHPADALYIDQIGVDSPVEGRERWVDLHVRTYAGQHKWIALYSRDAEAICSWWPL